MNDYDVTSLPFTCISRENWQMLIELNAETLYDVIQRVGNYVLTGEDCDCDSTLSKVVCKQLISVIDRKGLKARNSANNLKKKKTQETPTEQQKIKEEVVVEEPISQNIDEEQLFEEFFKDPSMDYSTMLTNLEYFKQRKRNDLNTLYQRLGKRYSGEQIIQLLQDKYCQRIGQ